MLVNQTAVHVAKSGCVRVKLYRVEACKETKFRITLECDLGPDDGLTLEELDMVQMAIRQAAERASMQAANEVDLAVANMPKVPGW